MTTAIQGGTVFTEVDKIVLKECIKILGEANILNKLPVSASNLYAKNVFNFISNLHDKENKVNINLEDEIIENTYSCIMEIDLYIQIKYIYIINICWLLCCMERNTFFTLL